MTDDLHYLSAEQALRRFRSKALSPVALPTALIDRLEATEPRINAFCSEIEDDVRRNMLKAAERFRRTPIRATLV